MQKFYYGIDNFEKALRDLDVTKFLLVAGKSFPSLSIYSTIINTDIPYILFSDFSPNPLHDDADHGRELYEKESVDAIVAVGGGSAMDVAKCIKFDSQKKVPIIAIPTTAGTGSESTRHIVVYRDGKKESLGTPDNIPDVVIFEPEVLKALPLYQKKCTMLDALCQSIESFWSVNANAESRAISSEAIKLIVANMDKYLEDCDDVSASNIMKAANLAGQAINITQTTAAHAMSYKITSMYKIPHGGAVALCLPVVWKKMLSLCDDKLLTVFEEIAKSLGCKNAEEAIKWFERLIEKLQIPYPKANDYESELQILTESVNPVRLKNNPVQFTSEELKEMYTRILR